MKHYENKTVQYEEKRLVKTICDVCGGEITYRRGISEDVTVAHDYQEYDEDGGGFSKLIDIDICPACFDNKLVPFIQSIAVSPIKYVERIF